MPIDQLRSLRDRVVVQQDALGSLPDDQKGKIEKEYASSGGKSEVSRPFQDYLRSKELGERFAQLKQNPPRPFGKK